MTTFLVATDSVHTTAAACDYLDERLDDGDAVRVLAVVGGDVDNRDAGDALNVVGARLPGAATERREGDPAGEILAAADAGGDELLLGARGGDPETRGAGLGSTAAAVLAEADCPVVVLPD
jgi:nucleotide-binding universal stress UspA family protein